MTTGAAWPCGTPRGPSGVGPDRDDRDAPHAARWHRQLIAPKRTSPRRPNGDRESDVGLYAHSRRAEESRHRVGRSTIARILKAKRSASGAGAADRPHGRRSCARTGGQSRAPISSRRKSGPLLLAALVGWLERHQQEALAYLIEENRVIRGQPAVERDRKSTRLNSSHVRISYAG